MFTHDIAAIVQLANSTHFITSSFKTNTPSLSGPQVKAVPDNRRQAESLSLSREVCRSRAPKPATGPPKHRPLLHSASGPHAGLASGAATAPKLTVFQELQDKKQTMDKILQELHSLRDQTLNNNSCK